MRVVLCAMSVRYDYLQHDLNNQAWFWIYNNLICCYFNCQILVVSIYFKLVFDQSVRVIAVLSS